MQDFLDNSIQSHVFWKIKLLTSINTGNLPEKSECTVDNKCELGKWIYGEGRIHYGTLREFIELIKAHKEFHSSIGNIIDLLKQGKKEEAKKTLETGSYNDCSSKIVSLLSALKIKINKPTVE